MFLIVRNKSEENLSKITTSLTLEIQNENEKRFKEVEEIQTVLYQDNGFMDQVSNKLTEKGIGYEMMIAIYSKDDIEVKYILTNKDASQIHQEAVKTIFYEVLEKNDLDSSAFKLKVLIEQNSN